MQDSNHDIAEKIIEATSIRTGNEKLPELTVLINKFIEQCDEEDNNENQHEIT